MNRNKAGTAPSGAGFKAPVVRGSLPNTLAIASGPVAPVSENEGAVEAAGGRETAGTEGTLTVRVGHVAIGQFAHTSCLVWPLGCRVAGDASSTQPTDALDGVPALMLKEHGRDRTGLAFTSEAGAKNVR